LEDFDKFINLLKPNTVLLLYTIIPYIFYKAYKKNLEDFDVAVSGLTLIISEIISPKDKNIFQIVNKFVSSIIGSKLSGGQTGGAENRFYSWIKFINRIISQVTINLTQWYESRDNSIENLQLIIKQNSSQKIIKPYQNIIYDNLDITQFESNKYYQNLIKLLKSTGVKLTPNSINKILKLIARHQQLEKSIDTTYNTIIEYTKILSGLKSDKICESSNIITENTISNCVNEYKQLIKKQSNINFILDNKFINKNNFSNI
jgi:hypothetical protein